MRCVQGGFLVLCLVAVAVTVMIVVGIRRRNSRTRNPDLWIPTEAKKPLTLTPEINIRAVLAETSQYVLQTNQFKSRAQCIRFQKNKKGINFSGNSLAATKAAVGDASVLYQSRCLPVLAYIAQLLPSHWACLRMPVEI